MKSLGERGLPRLLVVVGKRAELLRVKSELAGHLDVLVREPVKRFRALSQASALAALAFLLTTPQLG